MRHRAVRLSEEHFDQLVTMAALEALTMSQALRKAAILGAGGSVEDATAANAYMDGKRREIEGMLGPRNLPGKPRKHGFDVVTSESVVSCRMPQPWNARLSARGAFAAAVRVGLVRWRGARPR